MAKARRKRHHYLVARRSPASVAPSPPTLLHSGSLMRILGIDPGSLATGFGIVERDEQNVVHVAHGTIRAPRGDDLAKKLGVIHREILRVIEEFRPDLAVIERVFVSANPRSAIVLGQARGAALAALGTAGLSVHELAAREIKKACLLYTSPSPRDRG